MSTPDPDFRGIETRRLRLRRFRPGDAQALAAYRSDPRVARYQGWSAPYALAEAQAFIADLEGLAPGTPGRWFQFAVTRAGDDDLLGDCALGFDADSPGEAELGMSFARIHQGRGYAAEAVTALLDYAFERLALLRVLSFTDDRNLPARRLLARLGFRDRGAPAPGSGERLFSLDRGAWRQTPLRLERLARAHAAPLAEMARELEGEGDPCLPRLLDDPDGFFAEAERFADGRGLARDRVPMTWFLLFRGERLLGGARLRHRLIPTLERDGGHIGFEIRPSERGQGLARALLARMLDEARRIGLDRVLLTAAETHRVSRAVIEALGGTPDGTAISPRSGERMQRYWIELAGPAGITLRPEAPRDRGPVEALVADAFGRSGEAELVGRLRGLDSVLSLVAEREGELAGHVLFSPVALDGPGAPPCAALGPLAVSPAQQGRGIGARLVRAGLEAAAAWGFRAVFLAGDPRYYERFGFRSAPEAGFHYANPAFDPAFQVVELVDGALAGQAGVVHFHPAFAEAE